MSKLHHRTIRLIDYRQPNYLIDSIALTFELDDRETRVSSRLAIRANYNPESGIRPLRLDGHEQPWSRSGWTAGH